MTADLFPAQRSLPVIDSRLAAVSEVWAQAVTADDTVTAGQAWEQIDALLDQRLQVAP